MPPKLQIYLLRFGEITLDMGEEWRGEGLQRAMIDFHSLSPSCVTLGAIHKRRQLNVWDSWPPPPCQYQIQATSLPLVRFWPTDIVYGWPHAFFLFLSHPPSLLHCHDLSIHHPSLPSHFIYLSTSIPLSRAPPTDGRIGLQGNLRQASSQSSYRVSYNHFKMYYL